MLREHAPPPRRLGVLLIFVASARHQRSRAEVYIHDKFRRKNLPR
ncbi:hypothetical protein Deba_2757 [Desulfarculus baarsii DSM 2075]|uniref:Uncharacterized protein n=1 Tax=Desulfarculus baarsii (strain ATCC 33931 / DSM 2075 / LMG 7858 / VKM B-1802 / 2st14) TaxID=644282 RepID=E1QKL8_DESB2|nr:hypothetical protein Deba_2757 [Desulfarculus baarsii DSM 2075]